MELSIFIAKILGLAYLAIGFNMWSGKMNINKMIEEYENSSVLTHLGGAMSLIIGMLLIEYHNIWVKDWTVVITIIGWVATLKGVLLLANPKLVFRFKNCYKNIKPWVIFIIILGLFFAYYGFLN
jgi:hypothetical protein